MTRCSHCGTIILAGGERVGELHFCSKRCVDKHYPLPEPPREWVDEQVRAVHQGPCPKCGREGPCDVYTSHEIYSLIFYCCRRTYSEVSCHACGRRRQVRDALFSLIVGWWSEPGLFETPAQIVRNMRELWHPPDPSTPSAKLEALVRQQGAEQMRAAALTAAPETF
jgi:hypothetical protein